MNDLFPLCQSGEVSSLRHTFDIMMAMVRNAAADTQTGHDNVSWIACWIYFSGEDIQPFVFDRAQEPFCSRELTNGAGSE